MQRKTLTLCAVAAPVLLALALTCLAPVNASLWSSSDAKAAEPPVATAKPVALVTGISGMIGSFVARELLARGYEVHGVVRYRTHWGNLRGLMHAVSWHKGDITDEGFVLNLLSELRPDCVFHFAAQSLNGVSGDAPKLTMDVNALRVLDHRPLFFLAGSSTAYGKTAESWEGPIPEDAPLMPATQYGVSKVAAEMLGRQYTWSYGIPVVTARFFQQVMLLMRKLI
ncbi:hypothetical protein T484DRAFT_1846236 [Baffinella frigidus]|nr:hypothetical protein T484DRAFT_1846236 [Cryptophyta sp. CCMP2293]